MLLSNSLKTQLYIFWGLSQGRAIASETELAALKAQKRERVDSLKIMKDLGPANFTRSDALWALGVHLMSPAFRSALLEENDGRFPNFCKLVQRYKVHESHYKKNSNGEFYTNGKPVKKNEFSFVFFNTEDPTWEFHYCFSDSF